MAEADEVVVTTGAAGNLGRLMVQALHRSHQVVAIDRRPIRGLPKDVTHLRTDIRQRRIENIFRTRKVKAVYHLGLMHNPRGEEGKYRFNVVGTQRLLSLVAKYEVEKLVMLSSANIYGPDPDNSYFLTEDAPLLGADHHPEIRDLVAVDRLVQNFFLPRTGRLHGNAKTGSHCWAAGEKYRVAVSPPTETMGDHGF